MSRYKDITKQVFDHLTVVEHHGSTKDGTSLWLCRCECGNTTKVSGPDLRRGRVKSCGCTRYHGKSGTIEYRIFYSAKARAKRQSIPFGISASDIVLPDVCPILGIPLQANVKHMKDNSPTLDRIYPDQGYVPGNVVVVSLRANRIKSDCTPDELIEMGMRFKGMYEAVR